MGMASSYAPVFQKALRAALAASLALSIAACSWNDDRSQAVGGVLGGVFGAVLGSKVGGGTGKSVGVAMGATLGSMWGQDIAKGMSDIDKVFHERTTTDTLEYGKPGEEVTWSNPDSGNSGTVSAGETFKNDAGEECRTFESTVEVEGEDRTSEGTACRMDDGTWQVVKDPAAAQEEPGA